MTIPDPASLMAAPVPVTIAAAATPRPAVAAGAGSVASGDAQQSDSVSSAAAGLAAADGAIVPPTPTSGGQVSSGSGGNNGGDARASGQQQSGNPSDRSSADTTGDSQASAPPPVAATLLTPTPTPPPLVASTGLGLGLTGVRGATPSETPGSDSTSATGGFALGERTLAGLVPTRLGEAASPSSSPYAPTQAPIPVEQVALAIGRLTNGARSFSMQLNPEHLGSVDVRMDVDAKGKTKVAITADRPETLALLKLDSHHLVKALQDSGVSADQTNLSFSLREQGANTAQDRRSGGAHGGRTNAGAGTGDAQGADGTPVRMSLSRSLYDIHA